MRSHGGYWAAFALVGLGGWLVQGAAKAEAPAPAVVSPVVPPAGVGGAVPPSPTLWNYLGIPQGWRKLEGATINRRGNNPEREPRPPLKAIADPTNLASPNPAIKKAAEIKMEEDLAPQKIKAIKYLATVGCGCHPDVGKALLDALDDCTEAVRYEAVLAFCHTSGNPCSVCNKTSCCRPDVQKKLKEMAYGKDESGCYKEPSCRVRAAAAVALSACEMVMPSGPEVKPEAIQPQPEPKLVPVPAGTSSQAPAPAPSPTSTSARLLRASVPEPGAVSSLAGRLAGNQAKAPGSSVPTAFAEADTGKAPSGEPALLDQTVKLTSHELEPPVLTPACPIDTLQRIRNTRAK